MSTDITFRLHTRLDQVQYQQTMCHYTLRPLSSSTAGRRSVTQTSVPGRSAAAMTQAVADSTGGGGGGGGHAAAGAHRSEPTSPVAVRALPGSAATSEARSESTRPSQQTTAVPLRRAAEGEQTKASKNCRCGGVHVRTWSDCLSCCN